MPFDFDYEGNVVLDEVPENNKIKDAIFKMNNRKDSGLLRLSIDKIKGWYGLAFPTKGKEEPDLEALAFWNIIKVLIKGCWNGEISSAFNYRILVIIPKDEVRGVREIGLL